MVRWRELYKPELNAYTKLDCYRGWGFAIIVSSNMPLKVEMYVPA